MSVKAVVSLSCTPHATATRWIALLEQRGLIATDNDDQDGRRKLVRLTDSGRKALTGALHQFPPEALERV